jgi:hypothetical protein
MAEGPSVSDNEKGPFWGLSYECLFLRPFHLRLTHQRQ